MKIVKAGAMTEEIEKAGFDKIMPEILYKKEGLQH